MGASAKQKASADGRVQINGDVTYESQNEKLN